MRLQANQGSPHGGLCARMKKSACVVTRRAKISERMKIGHAMTKMNDMGGDYKRRRLERH
jgi:hypothetical protein